ncbi:hypothetical protein ACDP63_09115 [Paracoccus sp. P2]|uniref:hypothetical protein n=1 Tax=Paracoccus sp. P2 TaxID=3248840 RepID=UPI00391F1F95
MGHDSAAAFVNALEEKGYVLAKGDSRAFVVVDSFGDVHSLSRYVKGVRAKDINARLSALDAHGLPSVDQAKDLAKARLAAQEERRREQQDAQHDHHHDDHVLDRRDQHDQHDHRDDQHGDHDRHQRSIDEKRAAMEKAQRARRLEFVQAEQEVLTRQQDEKLALDAAQKAESGGLLFRMRARVAELIDTRPALRSVLGHITEKVGLDPRDRHRLEQEALARRHGRERIASAGKKRSMEKIEQREKSSFERDLKREALQRMLRQEQLRAAAKAQGLEVREASAEAEFLRTDPRLLEEGAFGREFNEEAAAMEADDGRDDHGEGEEEGSRKPRRGWKRRGQDKGHKHGRGRGKGYGYRRGD